MLSKYNIWKIVRPNDKVIVLRYFVEFISDSSASYIKKYVLSIIFNTDDKTISFSSGMSEQRNK